MAIYFYALIATILVTRGFSVLHVKKGYSQLLVGFMEALPFALVSGLRTTLIGTDLNVYGVLNFRTAHNFQSFSAYYSYIKSVNSTEYGYAALNYIIAKFSNNINVFLFIVALFTLVPFLIGTMNIKRTFNIPVEIQIILYFSIFYGLSLNVIRQSLAMSWFFLAVTVILQNTKNSWAKAFLLWLIAFSFHRTAIIGLVIFAAYYFFTSSGIQKRDFIKQSILVTASVMLLVIAIIIFKNGDLPTIFAKYSQYLDGSNMFSSRNIGIFRIIYTSILPIISIVLLIVSYSIRPNATVGSNKSVARTNYAFFIVVLLFDVVLLWGGIRSAIFPRLGQYFGMFEVFLIPLSFNSIIEKRGRWVLYTIIIITYLFLFVYITLSGENQIYPYQWILGNNY